MTIQTVRLTAACILAAPFSYTCFAAERPGVVSHVKVVSDKVEDVSSLDAWKKSFIRENMTEEEKAMAVWESVFKFQYQDQPPSEAVPSLEPRLS